MINSSWLQFCFTKTSKSYFMIQNSIDISKPKLPIKRKSKINENGKVSERFFCGTFKKKLHFEPPTQTLTSDHSECCQNKTILKK